jgi:hypothetical protein
MTLRIHRKIGLHDVDVFGEGGRWSAAVDGTVLPGRYASREEAQEGGFSELKRTLREEDSTSSAGGWVEPA